MGDICWPCLKIGQGHLKVMIYTYFVERLFLMLNVKFQNHRPSGSGEVDFLMFFAIYSWSCDLDHLYDFRSLLLRMLHTKFGFDWPNSFREEDLRILMAIYMYIAPGFGADQTSHWGQFLFPNHKSPAHLHISFIFSLQMTF